MGPEELKTIRQQLGLSQEGMGRYLGVAYSTVNRWESGKIKPKSHVHILYQSLSKAIDGAKSSMDELQDLQHESLSTRMQKILHMASK